MSQAKPSVELAPIEYKNILKDKGHGIFSPVIDNYRTDLFAEISLGSFYLVLRSGSWDSLYIVWSPS